MKRSVVIGIYADEDPRRLRQTQAALQSHAVGEFKVVQLLDAPNAATLVEAERWREADRIVAPQPVGAAACFNRLCRHQPADVYLFLESGAVLGFDALERLLRGLDQDRRNGLAGPSTNRCWNAQGVKFNARTEAADDEQVARQAAAHYGDRVMTLEPLYSLADFCYAVRREVVEEIGPVDEGYGLGPCWEMDFNIRAARAGWRGVWVAGAYVHRAPFTERRRRQEARWWEASKRRYQDKFCGARLRGEKHDYRRHCRGEDCPNFAPRSVPEPAAPSPTTADAAASGQTSTSSGSPAIQVGARPLVSCIMPTADRLPFLPQAIAGFLRQDYAHAELIIVDDGQEPAQALVPAHPRLRLIRLSQRQNVGAKRNVACAAAQGEYIVHWDDDDWYPADRVSRQVEALARSGKQVSGSSTLYYVDPAAQRGWRYEYRGGRVWVAGNTLAYRKRWWAAHPFPAVQVGEDTRFVWAVPADAVADMRWPGICVARVHRGNTSRKQTAGSSWLPCPVGEVQRLLGDEWPLFAELRASDRSTNEEPWVTCIMPTYNRRAFLPLALAAFAAQDYPRKELVVVDDGADDVGDLLAGQEHVRHVRLTHRATIGHKRNLACQAARGSIVAHWDDDDWYAPERLSWQVRALLAGPGEVTGLADAYEFEVETGRCWRPRPDLHRRMFVADVHGGTLAYWKRLFEAGCRYPEVSLAEDAGFLKQVLRRGKTVTRLENRGLFVYLRHGQNTWRYATGRFLDRQGWMETELPAAFAEAQRAAYVEAAASSVDRAQDRTCTRSAVGKSAGIGV